LGAAADAARAASRPSRNSRPSASVLRALPAPRAAAAAPVLAGSRTFSGKPSAVRPVAGVMGAVRATPSRRRISASERTSGRR
jgi:hypothetical protein